jgi:hypothetical protein
MPAKLGSPDSVTAGTKKSVLLKWPRKLGEILSVGIRRTCQALCLFRQLFHLIRWILDDYLLLLLFLGRIKRSKLQNSCKCYQ